MFLLLAFLLVVLLPYPWNVIGFVVCAIAFVFELMAWNRTVRSKRTRAGAETLIGETGVALSACRPDGQVRVSGATWEARCDAGVEAGEAVRVVAREELLLIVEPGPKP